MMGEDRARVLRRALSERWPLVLWGGQMWMAAWSRTSALSRAAALSRTSARSSVPGLSSVPALSLAAALSWALGACAPVGPPIGRPAPEPATEPRAAAPAPAPPAAAAPLPAPPPAAEPARARPDPLVPASEVRGLWVVRTALTDSARIDRMLDDAVEHGINTLLVQVRGRADAYYRSSIEPRAEALYRLRPEFDPLDHLLSQAHARGIAVHAWIATHLVWGLGPLPQSPRHLVRAHPDWLAVPRDLARELYPLDPLHPSYLERLRAWTLAQEGRVEGLYSDPSHPEARRRVLAVVEDLLSRYPLDGLHLDYIRYGSPQFSHARGTLQAFRLDQRRRVSAELAAELDAAMTTDPLAWVDAFPAEFSRWREAQITSLVSDVRERVRSVRPGATLSAAVFADPVDARRGRFQDWPEWLESGRVDVVVPMAYTADRQRFSALTEAARSAAGSGDRVWMGLGVYLAPFDAVIEQIALAREMGSAGVVLFSWDWMHDAPPPGRDGRPWLEALACEAFPEPAVSSGRCAAPAR